MIPPREEVRAMLGQALADAQAQHARRLTELHLELFDAHPETRRALCDLVVELSADTIAAGAQIVTFPAASRFICWNCCGLRFHSEADEAICPNCGELGMLIPPDVTFALDHVEVAL
jgi:Zn finger protein HypA/HybF involved in hydrogenase expression